MAGELTKSEAICLEIHPWSRTSHVVEWLTPFGKVGTVVKGAVRPKSVFLGQYDLNYMCEILYYNRAQGNLHALRGVTPLRFREGLRTDYKALALAGYMRELVSRLAPQGPDAADWYRLLGDALDSLATRGKEGLAALLPFELDVLRLLGLEFEIEVSEGEFLLRGERKMKISKEVAACFKDPGNENNSAFLLDAARVIGVYYAFHVDGVVESRRAVLRILQTQVR